MTASIPFCDGHNDFLLRLMFAAEHREQMWLGDPGRGHLDLKRMKQAGFSGGFFAIFVPPKSNPIQCLSLLLLTMISLLFQTSASRSFLPRRFVVCDLVQNLRPKPENHRFYSSDCSFQIESIFH